MTEKGADFLHSLTHQESTQKSLAGNEVTPAFFTDLGKQKISPGALRTYRSVVSRFVDNFPEIPTRADHIQEYIDGLPLSSESKHSHFIILRRFYRFLEENHGLVHVFDQVISPARDRRKAVTSRTPRTSPTPRTPRIAPGHNTVQYSNYFLDSCRARGLSVQTIENYQQKLVAFAELYPEIPTTPEPIEGFLADVNGGYENRYNYFGVIRVFYRFLEGRHNLFHPATIPNPITSLKYHPPHAKPLKGLEVPQMGDLLKACETNLDRTLIMLFIDTGIRVGEAASVERKDIGRETLTVRGKSGEREVPISPTMRDLLLLFAKDTGQIFTDKTGEAGRHALSYRVRKVFKAAGISGVKIGPHTLRHTFGRQFIKAGGDPFALQKTFGHSTLQMSRRYAELETVDLVEKHKKYSPLRLIEDQIQPPLPEGENGGRNGVC